MQISSTSSSFVTASTSNLLTGKIYSAGSVLKHNLAQAAIEKKLGNLKDSLELKEKISNIEQASSDELLQVSDIDSLYAVDGDLHGMDKLAQYASGDISSDDRKRAARDYAEYAAHINRVNQNENSQLSKDGIIARTNTASQTTEGQESGASSAPQNSAAQTQTRGAAETAI